MLFVVKGLNPETGSTTQLLCCVAAIPCYPSTGSNDPAHQELKNTTAAAAVAVEAAWC
jgi:hypothetical protein